MALMQTATGAVAEVRDEDVERFTAAGWVEVKADKPTAKKAATSKSSSTK